MNNLLSEFRRYLAASVSSSSVDRLCEISTPISFKADKPFVVQGQTSQSIFYVSKGITKHYIVNKDGQEANKSFTCAPCIVGSTRALVTQLPSGINLSTLKPAEGIKIQWAKFRKLMNQYHDIEKFYRIGLEKLFIVKEERESSFLLDSAEDRYREFLRSHETMLSEITQYHIASYLRINPVSLSRIRKQINASIKAS
jgi:CRP-like cAMP-binding protein